MAVQPHIDRGVRENSGTITQRFVQHAPTD